ncbi:DUF1990 family protein [Hymenobacter sp. HMF4947]|uniref:DUF1990 family protein n=2 Tax=Hymenobacter ginkgonis TaxID=2682976 RepID=A0A7K1T8K6_9BACT|nr:DUF1990 family protein [Hymenobacter ginkgonis]
MPSPTPPAPLWEQYRTQLAAYAHTKVNYDVSTQGLDTAATGWRVDDYATSLPPEPPGPAQAAGSFAAAVDVLRNYKFPPPNLITGIFAPDQPLEKRIMVLRAQFLGFTFLFGVQVVDVVAEAACPTPTGAEQVWGYGYRTLEGHFERGQINFSIHKNLVTGAVDFRIHAVSQKGTIRNPFYWLGFKVFGRMLQRRFARQSLLRMRRLVAEALTQSPAPAQTKPAAVG